MSWAPAAGSQRQEVDAIDIRTASAIPNPSPSPLHVRRFVKVVLSQEIVLVLTRRYGDCAADVKPNLRQLTGDK